MPFRFSAASCVIICYFLWEGERIRYLLPPRISPGGHPAAISTSSALDVERQTRDWNRQFVVHRSRPVMNLFICILRLSLLPCIVLPVFCVYVWNSFQGSIWLKTKFPFCSEMFCLTTDALLIISSSIFAETEVYQYSAKQNFLQGNGNYVQTIQLNELLFNRSPKYGQGNLDFLCILYYEQITYCFCFAFKKIHKNYSIRVLEGWCYNTPPADFMVDFGPKYKVQHFL